MSKTLSEILRELVDEYFVKAVLREDNTSPKSDSGAVSSPFISVRLASVTKPNVIASGSRPTLTFFELNPDGTTNLNDKEIMDQIRACQNEDGKTYDPVKLEYQVYHFRGVFYEFRAPAPFYIYNSKGERVVYPKSNKDKDKPVIGQTIPMFLYESQIENVDQIIHQAMSGREVVPLEEARQAVDQNSYHNFRAHQILKDYVAEESDADEEAVE